jgi:hypothetical protein
MSDFNFDDDRPTDERISDDEWASLLPALDTIEPDSTDAVPDDPKQRLQVLRDRVQFLASDDPERDMLLREITLLQERIKQDELDAAKRELAASGYVVTFAGRDFAITEPDIDDITALCRWIGERGNRAGQIVGAQLKGLYTEVANGKPMSAIPMEQIVFGFMSGLRSEDIVKLAIILLFGGSEQAEREGKLWVKDNVSRKQVKLAPLVQAFAYRVAQSDDLRSALKMLPIAQAAFQV